MLTLMYMQRLMNMSSNLSLRNYEDLCPSFQSPYGDDNIEPEKAPEAISKAVASLPPEQMFELMKQMKVK